jgi:ACT domain-containing protein
MILTPNARSYFELLQAKVAQAMGRHGSHTPYYLEDDPVITNYEIIREVWADHSSIKEVCEKYHISRSQYYDKEDDFVNHGFPGLYPEIRTLPLSEDLERLVIMVSKVSPSLSQQAILRIGEVVPLTEEAADMEAVSQILASYGRSVSNRPGDKGFWSRIQRSLDQLKRLKKTRIKGRNRKNRRKTFFNDKDLFHKRLELLRHLFYHPSVGIKEVCLQFGVSPTSYYRLIKDYGIFGPWAIIPGNLPGKETMSNETELNIILKKLRYPGYSAQEMVNTLKLRCSRYAVNRVFSRWSLTDRNRSPIALDQYCAAESDSEKPFEPVMPACHLYNDASLLESRRINRQFEHLCGKMRTHAYHLCDPGPLILAQFVNDLGIVQAMEKHGPPRLRGIGMSNLALLNVFRILAGYRRINHLSNNRDRSVALASGLGMFGSRSRYYEDTLEFKFNQIHALRCDLISRAKELELIEGKKIAFDFHFKRFFGSRSKEKGLGKGPDKAGNMVAGFRPHVTWDLVANTVLSMNYYHGGVRAPGILEQYCEEQIFPLIDPKAIQEIYMDSEYTKEASLQYFKQDRCHNGDVFLCLKKNKQIKKLIAPALDSEEGWEKHDDEDLVKAIDVILPKTKLPLRIVILKDLETGKNIRCFGSTNTNLNSADMLQKYRYRWLIENGLKDLVYSYFLDEMYGSDPQKVEFEFYCTLVSRLSYEYFLKELGGEYYHQQNGNKTTLQKMRNLFFEKRNFTLEQDSNDNLIMTILDASGNDLEQRVTSLLRERMENGKNKVLWWGNRGLVLRFKNQYSSQKVSR